MSQRARVALIFTVVGLVGAGAGVYFVKVYQPAQELKAAQQEIEGWEARYQGARDCLLGKAPGSAKTSEALAIREMAPDLWERGKCTPLVSKLSRGISNDTGIPRIEDAWVEVDKAAHKAALAFATHVGSSTTLLDDPLPAALDALDAARVKLFGAGKLTAAEHTGQPLPAAEIIPLADGNDKLTALLVDTIPSAHGIVLRGRTDSRMVQLVLAPGQPPKVGRLGPGSLRAVPDPSWGATPADKQVHIGAFDVEGAIASPSTVKSGDGTTVAAVAGSLNDGIVVFGSASELAIARINSGAVTAEPVVKIDGARAASDIDGRVAIVWTANGAHAGRVLGPGHDEPAVNLTGDATEIPCLTRDRVWVQDATGAVVFGGGKPVARKEVGGAHLQGCTPDAALFHQLARPKQLVVCADECRNVAIPSAAPEYAATTIVGGKLVAIAAHDGVLGVWREDAPVAFYALPEAAQPVLAHEWPAMALTDGKVIDVIARGAKTFVVVRIPAS